MRVGRSRKRNPFFDRELNDVICRIKFVHRFAPAGSGKFDGQIVRANEIEGLINDLANFRVWPMTMNLNQIEMRQTIDETGRGHFAHPPKVIGIKIIDVSAFELRGAGGNAVEHLRRVVEVMDRAENEIEFVQILFDPFRPALEVCGSLSSSMA